MTKQLDVADPGKLAWASYRLHPLDHIFRTALRHHQIDTADVGPEHLRPAVAKMVDQVAVLRMFADQLEPVYE